MSAGGAHAVASAGAACRTDSLQGSDTVTTVSQYQIASTLNPKHPHNGEQGSRRAGRTANKQLKVQGPTLHAFAAGLAALTEHAGLSSGHVQGEGSSSVQMAGAVPVHISCTREFIQRGFIQVGCERVHCYWPSGDQLGLPVKLLQR